MYLRSELETGGSNFDGKFSGYYERAHLGTSKS